MSSSKFGMHPTVVEASGTTTIGDLHYGQAARATSGRYQGHVFLMLKAPEGTRALVDFTDGNTIIIIGEHEAFSVVVEPIPPGSNITIITK